MSLEDEVYSDFRNAVLLDAEADGEYQMVAFLNKFVEELEKIDEVESVDPLFFEGIGRNRGKIRVDACDFSAEDDGEVTLMITILSSEAEIATITQSDVKTYFDQMTRFLDISFTGKYGESIDESEDAYLFAERLNKLYSKLERVRLMVCTNARASERYEGFHAATYKEVAVEYELWDLRRLTRAAYSNSGREEVNVDLLALNSGDGVAALAAHAAGSNLRTFLLAVPGHVLAQTYRSHGARVMESNVRSYLTARGKVNKGIQVTINETPENFLAFNNGITATAKDVAVVQTPEGLRLTTLRDFQIVNGGQTTASLFYVWRDHPERVANVFVQMKLVVTDEENVELVGSISRYANTQNSVNEADFFATHPFHRQLETHSRRVWAPAQAGQHKQSKWFYERSRGQYANELLKARTPSMRKKFELEYPKSQMITKTDAAKFLTIWDQAPHIASAGGQKNFQHFAKRVTDAWNKDELQFHEVYFQELVAKAIMYKQLRDRVMKSDWYSKGYLANIVAYAIAKFNLSFERQFKREFDLGIVWKQQGVPELVLDELEDLASFALNALTDDNRPVLNVTEWAKRPAMWEFFQEEEITLEPEMEKFGVGAETRLARRRNAVKTQKLDQTLDKQIRLVAKGTEHWNNAISFSDKYVQLTEAERGVLKRASYREGLASLTDRQIRVLEGVDAKLTGLGFEGRPLA